MKQKKTAKLTSKQRALADAYVRGDKLTRGNGVQSAIKAYNLGSKGGSKTPRQLNNTAAIMAHNVLSKDKVKEYINGIAMEMVGIVHQIARKGETDTNRLSAAKDMLDRAGFKPVDSVDVTSNQETIKTITMIVPNGSVEPLIG